MLTLLGLLVNNRWALSTRLVITFTIPICILIEKKPPQGIDPRRRQVLTESATTCLKPFLLLIYKNS